MAPRFNIGPALAGGLVFLSLTAAPALGQTPLEIPEEWDYLPGWEINGSNTLRIDQYGEKGDPDTSPHPFLGAQTYDDFSLNFTKQSTPYNTWRGRAIGTVNNSNYRSEDFGLVLERLSLSHENGEGRLPHRLDFGDFFGFFSFRTLQRSLKGMQVEIQPQFQTSLGERHSFQMLAGGNFPTYAEGRPADDFYVGTSWLAATPDSSLSTNFVYNYREENKGSLTPSQNQVVYSVAGEHKAVVKGQTLTFKGELSHFSGDQAGTGTNLSTSSGDSGYFAQVSGRSKLPLTYRFRFEEYGQDYRPNGGAVTANRRTLDSRAGWRFENGLALNARVQQFTDALESDNKTDTDVFGVDLSGPVPTALVKDLNMSLNAFVQDVDNEDRTTDTFTRSATLNFDAPVGGGWIGRLGAFWQSVNNRATTDAGTITRQLTLNGTRTVSWKGFTGSVTPGVLYRNISSATPQDEFGANLALNVSREAHSFNANYQYLFQDPRIAASTNIGSQSLNVSYQYNHGAHSFGFDSDIANRRPEPGGHSFAYRLGVFWTVHFNKPTAVTRTARKLQAVPGTPPSPDQFPDTLLLGDLAPGSSLAKASAQLEAAGIKSGIDETGLRVYRHQFYEELPQRQRVALEHDGSTLIKSAVIIDLDNVGDPNNVQEILQSIQRILIQRYGNPQTFDRGEFSANLANDISLDRFIRLSEWRTPSGVVRLGLPRRLDRTVRIEVQHAAAFPPPTRTQWSIERVR